jgi:hypothetical protein
MKSQIISSVRPMGRGHENKKDKHLRLSKTLFMPLLLMAIAAHSQTGLVTYTEDTATNFMNPERGLYYYTSSGDGATYQLLTDAEIDDAIINRQTTLIWRQFKLHNLVNVSNPTSDANFIAFRANMNADFVKMRNKGVKCIVRFSYTDNETTPVEPTKANMLAHIAALGITTRANEDVISSVEAGFIGTYGEWHYSNVFGSGSKSHLENPTYINQKNDRIEVGNAIMGVPNPGIADNRMVAFRTPYFQQIMIASVPPCTSCLRPSPYDGSIKFRAAAHNDCYLADVDDMGTYESSPVTIDHDYLEIQSRFTFDGGETCRNATIPYDTYYNSTNTLNSMSKFHFNYLNGSPYVAPGGISPNAYWATANGGNIYEQIKRRLGYRFTLVSSNVTSNTLSVTVKNVGWANLFNQRNVFLVLEDTGNGNVYQVQLAGVNTDPRRWDAGAGNITFTQNLVGMTSTTGAIPTNRTYRLYLNLPDSNAALAALTTIDRRYSIHLANSNSGANVFWNGNGKGWNNLFRTTYITNSTASRLMQEDENYVAFDARTYPNPFNNSFKFGISTSGDENISIQVFDMIGRLIDSRQINVTEAENAAFGTNYPAGVYNVLVSQGENVKTLRVVKQ